MAIEADPEQISPGRVAAWLSRHVEVALAGLDLSLAQYRLLALLDSAAAVPSALAERLTVSRPSVTAVVDGLVARGLVRRTPDQEDRRRVRHELTDLGRSLLAEADSAVEGRLDDVLAALPEPAGRSRARTGLDAWAGALHAFRANRLARVQEKVLS